MRYYTLDAEEEKLLDSFEKEEMRSVAGKQKAVAGYRAVAGATLGRTRNINIRLSERDLQKLKAKAAEKGIPYQTLVSSVLHQYGGRH